MIVFAIRIWSRLEAALLPLQVVTVNCINWTLTGGCWLLVGLLDSVAALGRVVRGGR